MKNIIIVIAVILITAFISQIKAQPFPPSNTKHLRHLKKELQLDDSQAEKVKDILKSSQAKLKELRDRMEAAREKDMEEMDKILDEQDQQISKLLNDTQKKKFEDMKDEIPGPQGELQPPMQGRPGLRDKYHGPIPGGRPGMDDQGSIQSDPGDPEDPADGLSLGF